jgi:SAM-dependent methyltransferase
VKEYYDARAPEYDDWYLGTGLYAQRHRPGWAEELHRLCVAVAGLPPRRTLDVACGTGFLTRHLRGRLTGLDQSAGMVEIARSRMPGAGFVQADALALPFADGAFQRLFTSHFYGHLEPPERARFLAEAARVAAELVVVDSALRPAADMTGEPVEHYAPASEPGQAERMQPRELRDGSRHVVYKRYFSAEGLARELRGEALFAGGYFVMVRSPLAGGQAGSLLASTASR